MNWIVSNERVDEGVISHGLYVLHFGLSCSLSPQRQDMWGRLHPPHRSTDLMVAAFTPQTGNTEIFSFHIDFLLFADFHQQPETNVLTLASMNEPCEVTTKRYSCMKLRSAGFASSPASWFESVTLVTASLNEINTREKAFKCVALYEIQATPLVSMMLKRQRGLQEEQTTQSPTFPPFWCSACFVPHAAYERNRGRLAKCWVA